MSRVYCHMDDVVFVNYLNKEGNLHKNYMIVLKEIERKSMGMEVKDFDSEKRIPWKEVLS